MKKKAWLKGYRPLILFGVAQLSPWVLDAWALKSLNPKEPLGAEFMFFFMLLGFWATVCLAYEYWFVGWVYFWLFRKERLDIMYGKIRGFANNFGSEDFAQLLVLGAKGIVRKIAHLGPNVRRRMTWKAKIAAVPAILILGVIPKIPKAPLTAVCRTARWQTGFVLLALANLVSVGVELGALGGIKALFRAMVH